MRNRLILVFFIWVFSAYGRADEGYIYRLSNWESFHLAGEEFISITIEPTDPWRKNVSADIPVSLQQKYNGQERFSNELSSYFADAANTFVHQTFVNNYPEIDQNFFKKLHSQNIMLDGQSSLVMIAKGDGRGSIGEILASVRLARRRGKTSKLPGEKKFGVNVVEGRRTKAEAINHRKFLNSNHIVTGSEADLKGWEFSTIELANLAAKAEYREISMSLLAKAMGKLLVSGGSYFANNIKLVAYDRLVLFCSEKLVDYYAKFGLKVKERQSADVVLMEGTTEVFHTRWLKKQNRFPIPNFGDRRMMRVFALGNINAFASARSVLEAILPNLVSPCSLLKLGDQFKNWGLSKWNSAFSK